MKLSVKNGSIVGIAATGPNMLDITLTPGATVQQIQDNGTLGPAVGSTPSPIGSTPSGSVIEEIARRRPISLNWRYPSHADLSADIFFKHFRTHRTQLRKKDGTVITLVAGTVAADAKPVVYVEQSDGSVVYETYLDQVNAQASGNRHEPLPAYNDRAEMKNDLDALHQHGSFNQLVNLDGTRFWPDPAVAAFGPAYEYTTRSDGSIGKGGAGDDGTIQIQDFA